MMKTQSHDLLSYHFVYVQGIYGKLANVVGAERCNRPESAFNTSTRVETSSINRTIMFSLLMCI